MDTHSEDDGENARTNRIKQEELRRRVGPVPHLPSPYSNSSEGDISDDSDVSPAVSPLTPLLTTNQRKRSGALQRQQLLEIIQANMEKNNLSFHTSRYVLRDQPHVKYRDIFFFEGKGCWHNLEYICLIAFNTTNNKKILKIY